MARQQLEDWAGEAGAGRPGKVAGRPGKVVSGRLGGPTFASR